MSISINLNVVGVATDIPTLDVDTTPEIYKADLFGHRAAFTLPNSTPPHGFTVRWGGKEARSVIPDFPGSFEGSWLFPPLPDLDYGIPTPTGLRVEGDHFMLGDKRWLWKGSTDFRLIERVLAGADIQPLLADRKDAGANLVRVLLMKANNTGWELNPRSVGHWDAVLKTQEIILTEGMHVEWTIFADTRVVMPNASEQQDFYARVQGIILPGEFLELVNEAGHPTQSIDVQKFPRPEGILASHGSGLTDHPAVKPYWDYATYHGRRMAHPWDARAAVAYSPVGFEEDWPKSVPMINEESAKPSAYGYNPDYARLMGLHARCGSGGTFHHDAWNQARLFSEEERICATAFYSALDASTLT